MRIKQIIIAGVALTALFGCGANNTESFDNRELDRVENVRYQPGQREMYGDELNQIPEGGRNSTDQGLNNARNRIVQNRDGGRDRNMFEDGRIDQDNNNNDLNGQSNDLKRDMQNRTNQTGEYRVAERIAEQVTDEVSEIDRAYVLTMGNNAYVACHIDNDRELNENNDLSDKLEKKVTEAVKDADNKIDHVYVSSNPDFIDLTSNYMRDLDRGEPIEGFFDQFTEMIERVFPTRNR
ncbi:YhcN/YlaJ family sporulation lipoprotein [Amphibacillus indicireducens]|uniref:YhcN/YlaJ family sporulation lipoprotein n=1 Tax=Amphibacillus indicireducens TaxID=1076330 RepID=A0ABP7VW43_9BACI